MSDCLITNVNTSVRKRSKSKFRSFSSCNNAIFQNLAGKCKLHVNKIKQLSSPKIVLNGVGSINANAPMNHGLFALQASQNGFLRSWLSISGVVNSNLSSLSRFSNTYTDKFAGNADSLNNLICAQKLYPIKDILNTNFVDNNLSSSNLFNKIDEGVLLGNYNKNLNSGFRVSDDDVSYIQPSSVLIAGTFTYKCEVSAPNYRPEQTYLLLRASAPLKISDNSPRYLLYNLILEDPSGNTIVKYKDIEIKGDASYKTIEPNYVTYISEPEINNTNLNTWENDYPLFGEASGYKLNISCDVICNADPFADGFDFGYEEKVCDTPLLEQNPNNYLALDGSPISTQAYILNPRKGLRLSAIEICNSGAIGVKKDNYFPLYAEVSSIGKRLTKVIRPVELFSVDYDAAIYPSNSSLWESSPDYDDNVHYNLDESSSKILLNHINSNEDQYVTLINSNPIVDSGRLTLKFSHEPPVSRAELRGGPFSPSFFKNNFDDSDYEAVTPVDNFFTIDSLELRIIAKKAPNTRDFAIDIVGYSDDKLLNVTPKVGTFLQNKVIPTYLVDEVSNFVVSENQDFVVDDNQIGSVPEISGYKKSNDLGLSNNSISQKEQYYKDYLTSIDAGDHYKLSLLPVIDSTSFKEYSIPLQIYEDRVDVGKSTDYSMSSYFENLYIDLFGIPDGASVRKIELVVSYKPTNAFNLFTFGRPNIRQLDRKDITLFPQGWSNVNDALINNNINGGPLSAIENIPHGYKDQSTLKTNYSRRWRGVDGGIFFGPYNFGEFDFSFYNPQADHPFLNGFLDLNLIDNNYILSNNNYFSDFYTGETFNQISGYYNGQLEVIKNIGLRFNNTQLFPHNTAYTTIDWTQQGDPLYGKLTDAFDCALRVSGVFGNINFGNIPIESGFSLYFRFTPDYNMSGVNYNLFNSGVLFSKWDAGQNRQISIGFENGKITAILNDINNGLIKLQDNQNYYDYQYPLSVVISHEGSGYPARLYCNNELTDDTYLKDESDPLVLIGGDSNLVCGYSSGSGIGSNIFIHEIGISASGNLTDSLVDFVNKKMTVQSFLDGQTHSFNNDSNKFKLHEFIDENTNDWKLGAFKFCEFSIAFDGFTKRIGKDYLVHYLNHNGFGYESQTNLTLPSSIYASGLSYHTQIENDFLRFNLTDIPDANPHFYAIPPRISKTIPRGYKFDERALVVDTILEHETYKDILWKDGRVGPKLIVSLYSKNQDPIYRPSKINWGLINRSIHHLKPSGCYEKISSTFNHDDLLDISEPWASYDLENSRLEFSEKYFSKDIDDMFLQYDLVYPCSTFSLGTIDGKLLSSNKNELFSTNQCGSPFESKIKIHSVNVRLEKALTYWTEYNDSMNLYSSGQAIRFDNLDLFVHGHSGIFASGFNLYTSGFPWFEDSGVLNISMFGISGSTTNSFNLFVKNGGRFNAFGSSDQLIYLPMSVSGGPPRFDEFMSLVMSDNTLDHVFDQQVSLFTYGKPLGAVFNFESINLFTRGLTFRETTKTGAISLYISNTDTFSSTLQNQIPLYINTDANIQNLSGVCTLFTTNFGTAGTRGFFSWNQNNFGSAIDTIDSGVPILSANDEIRGVDLICFGDCGTNRDCEEEPIVLHNLTWYGDSVCVDGGIFRPKGVYTNLETSGFNTDIGYSGHFYGIRKYRDLLPNAPYAVTIKVKTGSDSSIYLPSEFIEMDYGSNDFVNYSGVKLAGDKDLFTDDRQAGNKFGKSVAVANDVIAVGAPMQTLEYIEGDQTYTLEEAGAIFVYRRDPRPEGFSWPIENHKSAWKLEQKLTLPSGLLKDYPTRKTVNNFFGINFPLPIIQTFWNVGGEGRQLGHSLGLAVNENMKSFEEDRREILVAGGPSAKWNREFDDLNIPKINIGILIFADEYGQTRGSPRLTLQSIEDAFINQDLIFSYFGNPPTKFNIKVIVLEPRIENSDIPPYNFSTLAVTQPSWLHKFEIPRNSGIVTDPSNPSRQKVFDGIKKAFDTVFPYDETQLNNNIPIMLGVSIDNSMSLGERALEPGLSDFLAYYRNYSFVSGLKDFNNNSVSGGVYKEVVGYENWASATINTINNLLNIDKLKANDQIKLITSGVGEQFFNTNLREFNVPPSSGGRVYIFEKESGSWNLIQEIKSPVDFDFIDRYGHAVAISKDTNIIGIGSPYIDESCQVWQYNPDNKKLLFSLLRYFIDLKSASTGGVVPRYSQLVSQYNNWVEQYGTDYANEILYSNLTQTEKFEARQMLGINEYEKIFTYGYSQIPYKGKTWSWIAEEFAPTSRLGYSVAVNEDGNMVAFGAPTDSFNVFDDTNMYFVGDTPFGNRISMSYNSSEYDSEIGLFAEGRPSWQNNVNAGAVRLFEGREYYPHNSVVEYGKFGNLQQAISKPEEEYQFNYLSGVFRDRNFRKMPEDEVEIPKDAGLAFIITPAVDAVSDEIVDNIVSWLALGDRNLVIVGNDPIWEENGLYSESNRIINDLLRRLNSRMQILPARHIEEALLSPSSVVLPSYQPDKGIGSYVQPLPLQTAYGVGDIRMYFPDFPTKKMICFPSDPDAYPIDPRLKNEKCELPIMHNGDIRAEWNDVCIAPPDRLVFYKINWPFELNGRKIPCPSEDENQENALLKDGDVVPLLAAALVKQITFVQNATPPVFRDVPIIETINVSLDPIGTFLTDQLSNTPSFIWDSGRRDYTEYKSNIFNMSNRSSPWFVPRLFDDRQAILQARASTTSDIITGTQQVADKSIFCVEETVGLNNSKIIAIASVETESLKALYENNDDNISFYANMVAINSNGKADIGVLGGWTQRTSLKDGYEDSILESLFLSNGNNVKNNINVNENFLQSEYNFYDVIWVANPAGEPNDIEINKLKEWLSTSNKKLIITRDNSAEQINRMDRILNRLGSKIKSVYLPVKDERPIRFYTSQYPRDTLFINQAHPIGQGFEYNIEFFDFMGQFYPFEQNAQTTPIAYTNEPIFDNKLVNDVFFRLNPGVDKVSFPAVAGSGYRIFIDYITENITETNPINVYLANVSHIPNEPFPTGAISLNVDLRETLDDNPIYSLGNLSPPVSIGWSAKLNTPPIYNTKETTSFDIQVEEGKNTIDMYFVSIDPRIEATFVPKTLRILSISGVPMPVKNIPVIEPRASLIGFETIKESDGLPRLEYTINISGVIKSLNDRYCGCGPGLLDDGIYDLSNTTNCEDDTTCIKENYHNQLIEDGPIVAAQEYEMVTNFPAGVSRSRITVLSDSNLIQGKYMADEFGKIPIETDRFINSLYPVTQFPSTVAGKQYIEITKIVAPERGSPHKYRALKNNPGSYVNFGPVGGTAAIHKFDNFDSLYDPNFLTRPANEAWPKGSTAEAIEQFKSGIRINFYQTEINAYGGCTKFSGIIDQNLYVDAGIKGGIPQLMKEKGYDYLDFDNFGSGYLGDLFGYSIALDKNRLIVGAPFAAFSDNIINDWQYYNTTNGQSGIKLSYNGGAGAVYVYQKTFEGIGARGLKQPWEFIQKLRPEGINIGQDITNELSSQFYSQLGPNSYSQNFLTQNSIITDQFGYAVDIDSDIIVVGAPGHDFGNNAINTSGEFIRKEFNREFTIPDRTVVELGNSGIRQEISSGISVLNNGAIFTFENSIDDWTQRSKKWKFIEKIVPQGSGNRTQSLNENDFFGRSVSVYRANRTDSDYVMVGGAENNSYSSSGTDFIINAGAAYTHDVMLRQPPPLLPNPNIYIDYKIFGSTLYENYILQNVIFNTEPNKEYITSGIVYTDSRGNIFLEASGQDPTAKGFIQHRPHISSIEGIYFYGEEYPENLNLFIGGRYGDIIENMNLFVTATTGNVYNTLGMYTNCVVDFGSGILNLSVNKDTITVSDSGLFLYTSGVGNSSDNLNLRIRGY